MADTQQANHPHSAHDAHGHGEHAHASFAHPMAPRMLLGVFAALIALTIITVVAANFPLGRWEIVVSLTIATIKASLVVLFFMHLWYDKPFNALIFVASLAFVALFLGMTLIDSREYQPEIEQRTIEHVTTEVAAPAQ